MSRADEKKAMKIGIIGSQKSILGFKALGVETFGVGTADDLEKAKQEIETKDFGILFITEGIAERFGKNLEVFYEKALPAVLVIPGIRGGGKRGRAELKRIIEKAIGTAEIQIT